MIVMYFQKLTFLGIFGIFLIGSLAFNPFLNPNVPNAFAQPNVLISSNRNANNQVDIYSNGTHVLTSGLPLWFSDNTTNGFVPYNFKQNSTHLLIDSKQAPLAMKKSDCTITFFDSTKPISQNPDILIGQHFMGIVVKQTGQSWIEQGTRNISCTYSTNENSTGLYLTIQRNQVNWGNLTSVYSFPRNGKPDVSNWFINNNPAWTTNYKIDFVSNNKNMNLAKLEINSTDLIPSNASGNGWNFTNSDLKNNNIQFVEQNQNLFSFDQDQVISDIKNVIVNYNGTGHLNVKIQYGKNVPVTLEGQTISQDPTFGYVTSKNNYDVVQNPNTATSTCPNANFVKSNAFNDLQLPISGSSSNFCILDVAKFDTSFLPSSILVTSTSLKYIIDAGGSNMINCDINDISSTHDPATVNAQTLWNDAHNVSNGTSYVSNDSTCTTTGTKTQTLGSQANTDVQNSISGGWFAVGITFHQTSRDASLHDTVLDGNIQLQISFTAPVTSAPTNVSQTGGSSSSVIMNWTAPSAPSGSTIQGNYITRGGQVQPYSIQEPTDYWRLDGFNTGLSDSGTLNKVGTASGTENYTKSGKIGGAFACFNGSSTKYSSFTVGTTTDFGFLNNRTNYSISMWLKPNALSGRDNQARPVMATSDSFSGVGVDIFIPGTSNNGFNTEGIQYEGYNGTTRNFVTSTGNIFNDTTTWVNLIFEYDYTGSLTVKIYDNGGLRATGGLDNLITKPKTGSTTSYPLTFCATPSLLGTVAYVPDYDIDDVRVYQNHLLNSTEISSIVNYGISTGHTFTDNTGISPNTSYTYKIGAVNDNGLGSTSTNTGVSFASAPSSLAFSGTSSSSTKLVWVAPVGGNATITGYKIEDSTDGISYSVVTSNTGNSTTNYTVSGLSPSTTYYFRVSTINAGGIGLPITPATVTTTSGSGGGGGGGGSGAAGSSSFTPGSGLQIVPTNPQVNNTITGPNSGGIIVSVLPKTYSLQPGSLFQDTLQLNWNTPDNFVVSNVIIPSSDITIIPQAPLPTLQGSSTGLSNGKILYSLSVPKSFCNNVVLDHCVKPITYTIPITIQGTLGNGVQVQQSTTIIVSMNQNLNYSYVIVFGVVAIAVVGITYQIYNQNRKSGKTKKSRLEKYLDKESKSGKTKEGTLLKKLRFLD